MSFLGRSFSFFTEMFIMKYHQKNFPLQVALHGEHRKPGMFAPYAGMLYEWTKENLELEREGKLPKINIDFSERGKQCYSLCDAFHLQPKRKDPTTSFRNLHNTNLFINSSICEQANKKMSKDR